MVLSKKSANPYPLRTVGQDKFQRNFLTDITITEVQALEKIVHTPTRSKLERAWLYIQLKD